MSDWKLFMIPPFDNNQENLSRNIPHPLLSVDAHEDTVAPGDQVQL